MIDLDKLESRCKEASRNGYGKHPVIECASAESIMELITRLRQSEKDAARYRWLRDEARHHMDGAPLAFMTNYDGEPIAYPECGMVLHESYLDEAIDEAMQCK